MKQQEYYVTLKLKIESDPIQEEDLLTKEIIDERFKQRMSCIFDEETIEVKEFKSKLKVKEYNSKSYAYNKGAMARMV